MKRRNDYASFMESTFQRLEELERVDAQRKSAIRQDTALFVCVANHLGLSEGQRLTALEVAVKHHMDGAGLVNLMRFVSPGRTLIF